MNEQFEKRVLFVSYFFPPTGGGGVQRPLKTVKYLNKMGWKIDVLTTKNANYDVFDNSLLDEIPTENDDFRIVRVPPRKKRKSDISVQSVAKPVKLSKKGVLVRKIVDIVFELIHIIPDKQFTWASRGFRQTVAHYKKIKTRPDIIYSTALPISCHFVAKRLAEYFKVPWVAEYRDLWNDVHYHKRMFPTKALADELLERNLLKKAAHVIVVVPRFRRILVQKYSWLEGRISLIPNGYDKEDFRDKTGIEKKNGIFTIVYTGRVYENRNIAPLLNALKRGVDNNEWTKETLQVVFYGPLLPKTYVDMIHSYGLNEIVKYEGYLSHDQSVRALLASDYLLLVESSPSAFTGKIWEYMASEKPILAIIPEKSDLIDELKSYGEADISHFDDETTYEFIRARFNDWRRNRVRCVINKEYLESKTREAQTKEAGEILIRALGK